MSGDAAGRGPRLHARGLATALGAAALVVLVLSAAGATGLGGLWVVAGLAVVAGAVAAYPASPSDAAPTTEVAPVPILSGEAGAPAAAGSPDRPVTGVLVTGRLVTVGGRPLHRGMVTLLDAGGSEAASASTAEDGSFSLTGVTPGRHRLLSLAAPYPAAITPVDVPPGGTDLTVVARGTGGLRGVAVDGTGGTIAGVEVSVGRPGAPGAIVARTDVTGHFLLEDLDDGDWEVRTAVPGHEPLLLVARVAAGGTEYVRLVHQALATLRGLVGRAGPASGAEVILLHADGAVAARTRTDSRGAYRLDGLRAGDYIVVAGLLDPLVAQVSVASGAVVDVRLRSESREPAELNPASG